MVHSVCSFLSSQQRSALRSLDIDTKIVRGLFLSPPGDLQIFKTDLHTALHSLRMLPESVEIRGDGVFAKKGSEDLRLSLTTPPAMVEEAKAIAAGDTALLGQRLRQAEVVCSIVASEATLEHDQIFGDELQISSCSTNDIRDPARLLKIFLQLMKDIREAWDKQLAARISEGNKIKLTSLLQFEVEILRLQRPD